MSWTVVRQEPSFYEIIVVGRKVSVILASQSQAESGGCWENMESFLGKPILGVGNAGGRAVVDYPRNLDEAYVVSVPIQCTQKSSLFPSFQK